MPLTDVQIASKALMMLGADAISSFEDGSAEADVASALYGDVRDALLSLHPWSFAKAQQSLSQHTASPLADWSYAYQIPPAFLRAVSLGFSVAGSDVGVGRGADYRIFEGRIHTDLELPILTFVFRPSESAFPGYFTMALIKQCAAAFCMPITENTARTQQMERTAEVETQRAKQADDQGQPPSALHSFSLIEARY